MGIESRSYFRRVDARSYHNFKDCESSFSAFSRNDFDRFPKMHPKGYSNTRTELVIPMNMINLLVVAALPIEVLDTMNMVLIPNSLRSHTFLIMDHQANHLSQHIQVMNNSFDHILTTGITVSICILVVGLMMIF